MSFILSVLFHYLRPIESNQTRLGFEWHIDDIFAFSLSFSPLPVSSFRSLYNCMIVLLTFMNLFFPHSSVYGLFRNMFMLRVCSPNVEIEGIERAVAK